MAYSTLSAGEIGGRVARGEVSAETICRASLERIAALNPQLKIFLAVDEAGSLAAAAAVDKKRAAGQKLGPLAGVPVTLKDNLCTKNFPTTCASKILDGWKPPYNAAVVEALQAADAVVMGKANMDEFAMGSSCENSAFHPTYNPWNPAYVVGGSSGGSAAAVAAGLTPLALGSDTGGSIRQPAALCGVMGLKPTYGRVSRYGLMAFASSLDQIGPFARTAADAALLLSVISGHDRRDSTSTQVAVPDYGAQLAGGLKGLKVGLPQEYYGAGLDPQVRAALDAARKVWEDAGAEFVEVSLPHTEYCLAVYYLVATAEASSNLARYDGVQYGLRAGADNLIGMYGATRDQGFGPEVKRRIMLGTYALSAGYYDAYYKKALQVRTLIQRDFNEALQHCDMIFTPTSPTPAFKLGERMDDPLTMYLSDIYTISVNLAGLPGLSVPCGFTSAGLPVGLQLIGKAFEEGALLRAAQAYQSLTDWHARRPGNLA
ncbi:MAG: Asp-tRNA(Asn)/Glu-tRNA(Gln) amidotransferase subunit GatA [Candidatus Firestonebacteria bacterium]|nr:Asp-tRNA(Asn)/Glu-tRNA(Gln) amidotransferase subunit GatA [Candidatus Firestonebacteria bacterium]